MRILRGMFCQRFLLPAVTAVATLAASATGDLSYHVELAPVDNMSASASAAANRRQGQIKREVVTLPNHGWAGVYSGEATGHFKMMWLAPKSGFVFYGCGNNGVCDQNYGDIIVTDAGLRFRFALVNRRAGPVRFAPTLIPVRWGRHRFLIPPSDMLRFCNDVNSGRVVPENYIERSEPGSSEPLTGLPDVPRIYQKYLLAQPVHARILSILSSRKCLAAALPRPETASLELGEARLNRIPGPWARLSSVTLDAGTSDGVFPGMVLWEPDCGMWATVNAVTVAHRCHADIRQEFDDNHIPQAGCQFISHPN